MPQAVRTCDFMDEPLIEAGISDYTFIPLNQGGLLGRGKFSSVQLAWKNGKKVRALPRGCWTERPAIC